MFIGNCQKNKTNKTNKTETNKQPHYILPFTLFISGHPAIVMILLKMITHIANVLSYRFLKQTFDINYSERTLEKHSLATQNNNNSTLLTIIHCYWKVCTIILILAHSLTFHSLAVCNRIQANELARLLHFARTFI